MNDLSIEDFMSLVTMLNSESDYDFDIAINNINNLDLKNLYLEFLYISFINEERKKKFKDEFEINEDLTILKLYDVARIINQNTAPIIEYIISEVKSRIEDFKIEDI